MRRVLIAMSLMAAVPGVSPAQTQISPVRVEFTRPGGTPGMARAVVRPSGPYMIAPAQPKQTGPGKGRKRR